MTQEAEKNMTFTKDSSTYAGFGTEYHKPIEEGIRAGLKEIPLEPACKPYGESTLMVWQPKVTEQETRPGFYNFNGYQATLMREGMEPISQFIPNFKMTGMTAEQSQTALQGGTVLHADWDNKQNAKKFVFAKFGLSQPVAPGENYPVIRINARDLEIGRLYSKEDVVGNQQDKEKHLAQLQSGARFPVKVREQVQGGAPRYPTVWLELNILDDKTMAMRVTDAEGKVLREPTIQAKQQELNKTMGMLLGSENQAKLPEGLLRMLQDNNLDGPRIGGRGRNIA
jgi:hypothetical protein